jgi:hypothetical protein
MKFGTKLEKALTRLELIEAINLQDYTAPRSATELLWQSAYKRLDIDGLRAIRSDLETMMDTICTPSEQTTILKARAELDGLIVARLAKGLRSDLGDAP